MLISVQQICAVHIAVNFPVYLLTHHTEGESSSEQLVLHDYEEFVANETRSGELEHLLCVGERR